MNWPEIYDIEQDKIFIFYFKICIIYNIFMIFVEYVQ